MLEQVLSCVRLGIIFHGDRHTIPSLTLFHVLSYSTVTDGTTAELLPKPGI